MLKRNLWKLLFSFAIVVWAVWSLYPLQDQDFGTFAKSQSRAKTAEFSALLKEAGERRDTGKAPSAYVALQQITRERKIDLGQFFPNLDLGGVKNIERRNSAILEYLLKESKGKLQLGLDLKGGVGVTLEAADNPNASNADERERKEKLNKAIDILNTRLNGYGVTEPIIRAVGTSRIEIQLPGVNTKENPEILDSVQKPARLDFRLVHPQIQPSREEPRDVPVGYEVMSVEEDDRQTGENYTLYYVVKQLPEMTGKHIRRAVASMDNYGGYQVNLSFDSEGTKEFAEVTTKNTGRLLGVVLDGKLYSAPRINDAITGGNAQITGRFDQAEAEKLANVLNNPLDLPLIVKQQYEVGPSLAQDAISSGIKASVIGTVLVAAFMITYYTIGGVVAVVTLAINVLVLFGLMAMLHVTLSMPGLAGIILTIGMAVDANILIFERMRDELSIGKSLKTALVTGYDKALITIVDAHITQVLICAIMILWGTGPIKGFGVTLAIGVFSTLFSTLIVSHLVMEWLIECDIIKRLPMLHFFHSVKVDFVRWGKPAFIASWAVVLLGLGVVVYKGDRIYGVDFAGGDVVTASYAKRVDLSDIRSAAVRANIGEVNPTFQKDLTTGREVLKLETAFGKADALLKEIERAHPEAGLVEIGRENIGPSIGAEIKWNAVVSTSLSLLVVLLYIAFRFEFGFAIGAVVSTLHDILMTIGIFVLFNHQFSAPMVAAILCIAGYSINDTVVVFDRIREELHLNPGMGLREVVNGAISRVFSRSLMTSVTAFLAAFALFIFGGGIIHDLSFTFLVGIVTGTFSSIFIASPIFYWWHKGDRKHVEKHQDVKPTYEWTGASKASQ
ncbi:MAG TPA: protein translocase subunit SecD [Opitutaceae bacterium]|nr:protein translocase subunit SecD [Opitutaceae bacterium]